MSHRRTEGADGADRTFAAIERMLGRCHPKEDPAILGRALRESFVSPSAMLDASPYVLERTGLNSRDALLVSQLRSLNRFIEFEKFGNHPQLGRLPLAAQYLLNVYNGIYVEQFYVLCLNLRGRLIDRVMINEGSEDAAIFNMRKMTESAVTRSANAVVLAHNHPGGTLRPSQADIDCTRDAIHALKALGVPMLDHIIIADAKPVSLRENGFIPAPVWMAQSPENRLLKNWLSTENMPKNSYRDN